jgi:hypothetical protein
VVANPNPKTLAFVVSNLNLNFFRPYFYMNKTISIYRKIYAYYFKTNLYKIKSNPNQISPSNHIFPQNLYKINPANTRSSSLALPLMRNFRCIMRKRQNQQCL